MSVENGPVTTAAVLSARLVTKTVLAADFPRTLNLGSGKDFRADCFNIDIDDGWAPDAVIDLGRIDLDENGAALSTVRFGEVRLTPGSFDRIITNDVLEHVPDLMKFMTNCLRLLRVGGAFDISVPYDLSFGAWQDPTHVRAFNERSWLYYTDWFWYMGWSDARFTMEKLQFVPSAYGKEMNAKGISIEELVRMPRAVDSMSVTLRKIELTDSDRKTWQYWRERREEAKARSAQKAPARAPVQIVSQSPAAPINSLTHPFAGGWEAHRDRHCIWVVSPDGYTHSQAFSEVAQSMSAAFAELGGSAPLAYARGEFNGRAPIIFGANMLTEAERKLIPATSVIFNLEQVKTGSMWINDAYMSLLKSFPVLDYSAANQRALAGHGVTHAQVLPIGYAPVLTRVMHEAVKDIDVLFYGCRNERRRAVLDALKANGVNVVSLFNVYGAARDAQIGRAKLVLNLHFYDDAVFEIVRVSYLLANRVCVLTEAEGEDEEMRPFAAGLASAPSDGIVARCLELLANDGEREALAAKGFDLIARRRQADLLRGLFSQV